MAKNNNSFENMRNRVVYYSLINSLAATVYIAIIAEILYNAEKLFGNINSALGILVFLLLFVLSGAIISFLLFGKPLFYYLNGYKRDCLRSILYTLSFMLLFTIFFLLILIMTIRF